MKQALSMRGRILRCGLALWVMGLAAGPVAAKSLYLIASINASPSPIRTYDIQTAPTQLVFQATQTIPNRAGGAVGLAIDTDNRKLFATYENSNVIQLVDATKFDTLGTTTAPGAVNLAGLVVDQGKKKVYTVDRNTNHLYVYSWDSATNQLTLDGGAFVALAGVASAHGLALDEGRGRLYIGDNATSTVRYYNTSGWGIGGSFTPTGTEQTPMGIAVDSRRNTVYLGNAYGPYGSRGQLVKYALDTGTTTVYTLPGATTGGSSGDNIVGVAVDEDTGQVYATTGNQGSGGSDTLLVFDQNLVLLKSDLGDIGDPTGVAIPRASISYNPLNFSLTGSANPVASGANLTYHLCYDNRANTVGATNVAITDTVPTGASIVSATGPATVAGGTVTWTIGPVAAGAAQVCHDLVVKVTAAAGAQLFNSATITGTIGPNTVPTSQTVTTDVIGGYKPLTANMVDSADPVPTGTSLTYTTCVNPGANSQTVNNVQLSNPIPTGTSFVSATGGGMLSGSAVQWNLGNLAPESANVCVDLVLQVTAAPGTQLHNAATLSSDNTPAQAVDHATDVVSNYKPLRITYDDDRSTVPSGTNLSLQVCFDNSTNTLPVSNVRIRGPIPDETSYVSSTGPASFDGTYVTWTVGNLAAGAPPTCYTLVVRVNALPGANVSGTVQIDAAEVQPASSAAHTTAVVTGVQTVVVEGQGDGGGGSAGWPDLLFGAAAAAALAWRRHRRALGRPAALLALLGVAVGAPAAGPGWFVWLGGGQAGAHASASQLENDLAGLGDTVQATMDRHDTGWKVFGGYRFNPTLAIEGAYVDLGRVRSTIRAGVLNPAQLVADVTKVHPYSITGTSLAGLASVPMGSWAAFAKLGVVRWDAKVQAQVVPAGIPLDRFDDKGTGATVGAGLSYDLPGSGLTLRGEWERFHTRRNDPEFISLSLVYRF